MRLSKRTIKLLKECGKKHKFVEVYGGFIRVIDGCVTICPICAMANDIIGEIKWAKIAYLANKDTGLNIPIGEVSQIMLAADFKNNPYRRYLKKHLGMT